MHVTSESEAEKTSGDCKWKCISWGLIVAICISVAVAVLMVLKSIQPKRNYVAAVIEYSPIIFDSPRKTILENVEQYKTIIHNASHYGVDIIVFPESGLTGVQIPNEREAARGYLIEIPCPESKTKPCSDPATDKVLQKLSCAAKNNKIYVAVNLAEIEYCEDDNKDCPRDNAFFYNTNIVFDRDGTIIAKYRKYNSYVEKAFNTTAEPELCTFKTDFDVTFGMFISSDILFSEPSVKLVKEKHVTDIVYSAAWISEMPLLTAASTQAAWAYSMDVNLLAAGYNCPQMAGGGSGIYAGTKGPLIAIMPRQSGTKLLIATVPKKNGPSSLLQYIFDLEQLFLDKIENKSNAFILSNDKNNNVGVFDDMKLLQDPSLRSFEIQPLSISDNDIHLNKLTYEHNGFICQIAVKWKSERMNKDYVNYKLIAFSGNRSFSKTGTHHIEACGLILCAGPNDSECGIAPGVNLTKSDIEFEFVNIWAKSFNISSIPVPSTLNSTLYPLKVADFTFNSSVRKDKDGVYYLIKMSLTRPVANLITFAIYKLPSNK